MISVNCTLNPYAFLITLVHEMAHFHLFEAYQKQGFFSRPRRVPPHGKEWKQQFSHSLEPFLTPDIFPEEIRTALHDHLKNPPASSCTDLLLARVLIRFDQDTAGILMEDLPDGSLFIAQEGRLFRKETKLRKRIRCIRLNDGRIFLFSSLFRVFPAPP